jgi:agmatinase
VELYDEVLGFEPSRVGVVTRNLVGTPAGADSAQEIARRETRRVLAQGRFPVVIGGEHSLSHGVYRALAQHHPGIGVIQLDAHADLRDDYEGNRLSHACVMARIREHTPDVLQLGVRSLSTEEATRITEEGLAVGMMHRMRSGAFDVRAHLHALPQQVFLTLDVDALDLSLVRATGTPEPGGFTWTEINDLLELIFATKSVVGLDVMELCGGDPPSAFTVARLVQRMIGWRFGS